jgi:transposase-like protein
MKCPLCSAADLVVINITTNGRALAMKSCHHCETKWWEADGENVGLPAVLLAAKVKPAAA